MQNLKKMDLKAFKNLRIFSVVCSLDLLGRPSCLSFEAKVTFTQLSEL